MPLSTHRHTPTATQSTVVDDLRNARGAISHPDRRLVSVIGERGVARHDGHSFIVEQLGDVPLLVLNWDLSERIIRRLSKPHA